MNINPFGPYYAGALRAVIASCFINGRISEQQIDFAKEVISKFREAEIDHLAISASEKEELKSQWKQWLDAYVFRTIPVQCSGDTRSLFGC